MDFIVLSINGCRRHNKAIPSRFLQSVYQFIYVLIIHDRHTFCIYCISRKLFQMKLGKRLSLLVLRAPVSEPIYRFDDRPYVLKNPNVTMPPVIIRPLNCILYIGIFIPIFNCMIISNMSGSIHLPPWHLSDIPP